MSYDISLVDPLTRETLQLDAPHHMRGGTYAIGGTCEAHLNVTYNYGVHFRKVFEPRSIDPTGPVNGIRTLYGLTGAQSLPLLDRAISMLGDDVDEDYWKPTEGNAKRALWQLRALAQMRPDGLWVGD